MSWGAFHLPWAGCQLLACLGLVLLAAVSRRHRGFDAAARVFLEGGAPPRGPASSGDTEYV